MGGNRPEIDALKERLERLERENRELSAENRALGDHLRAKTNRLLELMKCPNPVVDHIDHRTLLELDTIGTVTESFSQVLDHLHEMNDQLQKEIDVRGRAEQDLREKEELFRTVTEFSADWIFWRNPDGGMIYVAPACEQVSGYTPEEFYSDPSLFSSVVHPEDKEAWLSHCRDSNSNPVPGAMTFRILAKNGETRWISHTCRPVFGEKGDFLGTRGSNRDITRDKKMDEEMLITRKMEAVAVLAGGIAHDFNNLLTVIMGNISLMKQNIPETHSWNGRLAEVEKASLKARDLANRLITFSGGGAPIREPVSIRRLVDDVIAHFNLPRGIRCELIVDECLPPASIDETQVRQVMDVLILNACESMPGGGVVRIRAEKGTAKGDSPAGTGENFVEISVEDQGVGIEEGNLRRIFDPFFTTKKKSGLGLAAAYSIVQQHGGGISVESRVGKGTIFTVRLPVAHEAGQASGAPAAPGPASGRRKVLVMDDDRMLRAVILDILDTIGYEGAAVADGEEAVESYRAALDRGRPYDAVILDLTVPDGMGGVDAVGKILEVDPRARVIVSSGYSNAPVMSEYERYGFMGVITKPYRIQDLREILGKVMYEPTRHRT